MVFYILIRQIASSSDVESLFSGVYLSEGLDNIVRTKKCGGIVSWS